MLTSQEFLAQVQDFYCRKNIDPSSRRRGNKWSNRNDAHWPKPKHLGGTETIPLLKDAHLLLDLLASEDFHKQCFHSGDVKRLLRALPDGLDSELSAYFWHLYWKWAGSDRKGRATYRDPETGATALLTSLEANQRGWVHVRKGKGTYRSPTTGEVRCLTAEEAEELGWVGTMSGPQDVVTCPLCGKEGGKSRMHALHFDNCVEHEGSWKWFKEQLKEADPAWRRTKTGQWSNDKKLHCPHCKNAFPPAGFAAHHGDNCIKKPGSWRWFVEQVREADPTWRKRSWGKWTRSIEYERRMKR